MQGGAARKGETGMVLGAAVLGLAGILPWGSTLWAWDGKWRKFLWQTKCKGAEGRGMISYKAGMAGMRGA
jgi:hypothetical protein